MLSILFGIVVLYLLLGLTVAITEHRRVPLPYVSWWVIVILFWPSIVNEAFKEGYYK